MPTTNSEFNLLVAFSRRRSACCRASNCSSLSRLHDDEVYDRSSTCRSAACAARSSQGRAAQLIRTERGAGYVFTATVETVR
jgi:DNA-binding response OmpR family regulator